MVPMVLGIKRGANPLESFAFELASHRLLTPQLVEIAALNCMLATEKLVGASTVELSGRIEVRDEPAVVLDHFFSGDQAGASAVGLIALVTQALLNNDFKSAELTRLMLTVNYLEDNRFAQLDRVAVIDVASRRQVGSVPVGVRPRALAMAADGSYLFCANMMGSVSVIDPAARSGKRIFRARV